MLEKYIAALLVPYLSRYVENIDERQLSVDIWSGKATLNDLVLKKDVLNTILSARAGSSGGGAGGASGTSTAEPDGSARRPLPLRVHRGVCKSVTLDIPVTNLRSRPVVVNIGEVLITLVAPEAEEAEEEAAAAAHAGEVAGRLNAKAVYWDRVARKKAKALDAFEEERRRQREAAAAAAAAASAAAAEAGASKNKKKSGFFSRLGELVINNIIVKARTVHIRYEDFNRKVVLGAVLGGVQLLTIDSESGEATFVDPTGLRCMGKRLELEGLQVYCDDPRHMAVNEVLGRCWVSRIPEWRAWYHAMRQRSRDGDVALSTIFGPVTCSVDARIVAKQFVRQMLDTPYMTVTAQLQHIIAHLTRAQYTTLVKSISRFTNWSEVVEVAALRPRVPVHGNAKVWWRFAIRTVMSVLKEPRVARITQRISEICRLDYQVLYRDVVRKTEMSPEKRRSYRFITRFMTVEDMILGRKYVYTQLANEIQLRRKDKEARQAEAASPTTTQLQQQLYDAQQVAAPAPQKTGWFSWLRGGAGSSAGAGDKGGDTRALSKADAEEEAFLKSLEKDYGLTASLDSAEEDGGGSTASSPPLPTTYPWLFLSVDMPFMSFQIDMEEGESACLSFFQLYAQLQTLNKASSCQFFFTAQNLTLSNPTTGHESGSMIANLIEGVSVSSSPRAASGTPSSGQAQLTQVRSLTDVANGKLRLDRAPTLREILGLCSADSTNSTATEHSTQSNASSAAGEGARSGGGRARATSAARSDVAVPLLSISGALHPVEQPLPDTRLDAAASVRLLPLRIVADPGTVRRILDFFRLPRGVDLTYFKERARSAATAVGTAASQELRTAMASAKGFSFRIDASAPMILLPRTLRGGRRETTLSVSLGRIRFHTQPLSEAEKQRRLTSAVETEDMLYYSNRASFKKFFVELTTLEDALMRPGSGMLMIPTLAMAANVLQRIDDRNDGRERVILRLKVPRLTLALSTHQVYLLTSTIDAWVRDWVAGTHTDAGATPALTAACGLDGARRPTHRSDSTAAAGEVDVFEPRTGGARAAASLTESPALMPTRGDGASAPIPTNPPGCLTGAAATAVGGGRPSGSRAGVMVGGSGLYGSTVSGRRSGGLLTSGDGAGSAGVSNASSPSAVPLSGRLEDLPVFRLELLVEALGIDLHEDDPETLQPIAPARFGLAFRNAELILAVRTAQKKALLYLHAPCVSDLRDPAHPILSGPTALSIDVGLVPDTPTSVGVVVEPAVCARVGTALMELVETMMDIANLVMACADGAGEESPLDAAPPLTRPGRGTDKSGAVGGGGDGMASHEDPLLGHSSTGLGDPLELQDEDNLESIRGIGVSATGAALLTVEEVAQQAAYLNRHKATLSDLAYQLGLVRLQSATPDTRTMNISIHVDGATRVELFNRSASDTEDRLFLSAAITDVSLFCKKNKVTMEVTGKVSAVTVALQESHGLRKENSSLFYLTLPPPPTVAPPLSRQASDEEGGRGGGDSGGADPLSCSRSPSTGVSPKARPPAAAPHMGFTFRKHRPVMPLFSTLSDGKRVLTNAAELRPSSTVELELGGSTVTVDVETVMLLKLYFVEGFFTRLSRVAERPLYNGRSFPPTREGPRLLMGTRVVARDVTIALPLDARRTAERFSATVGSLVVQSSLHAGEGHATTSVSLRELTLSRDTAAGAVHSLLPRPTSVELAMRSPIDPESDETPRLDVKSEDFTVDLTSSDLLDLCQLLRQNVARTEVPPSASVAVRAVVHILVRPTQGAAPVLRAACDGGNCSGDSGSATVAPPAAQGGSGMSIGVRLAHAALRFSTDKGAADAARFEVGVAGCGLTWHQPSRAAGLSWRSLELLDTRGGTTSPLIRCDAGDARLADSLTTPTLVHAGFGVRPVPPGQEQGGAQDGCVLAVDEEDGVHGRLADPADGRARPGSVTGSDVSARPALAWAEVRASGGGGGGGDDGSAAPGTSLMSMSVLSVAFTLRRFAVSDQWLSIYDYFCNEALVGAWGSPPVESSSSPALPSATAAAASAAAAGAAASAGEHRSETERSGQGGNRGDGQVDPGGDRPLGGKGFRCIVTTPSVVVPFLTTSRDTLFEASIGALLVDTVSFPGSSTHVAVKVRELEVLDVKSGEYIVTRRRGAAPGGAGDELHPSLDDEEGSAGGWGDPRGSATGGVLGGGGGAAAAVASAPTSQRTPSQAQGVGVTEGPSVGRGGGLASGSGLPTRPSGQPPRSLSDSASAEPEALSFFLTADPAAHENRLRLSLGRLDVVYSAPLIYGMVDYAMSPSQPIARLSSLGVMREQRERMARAAQEMVDRNVVSMRILWHEPRIVLVGDGTDLTNHAHRLEARLGTMKASVTFDKAGQTLSTTVRVRDFAIPTLLEKSGLRVSYTSRSGTEEVSATLDRTVGLFFPAEASRVTHVLLGNLTLPRETYYYGKFDTAEERARPAGAGVPRESTAVRSTKGTGEALAPSERSGPASALTGGARAAPHGPTRGSAPSSSPSPTPAHRTVTVQIHGLVLEVHDLAGISTHTLTLSSLSALVAPSGDVSLVIPTLRAVEHFTNCAILASGATDASGAPVTRQRGSGFPPSSGQAAEVVRGSGEGACQTASAASPAPLPPPDAPRPAISMRITREDNVTELAVNDVVFSLVPRGTGVLANTLLSVHQTQARVAAVIAQSRSPVPQADRSANTSPARQTSEEAAERCTDRDVEELLATTRSGAQSRRKEAPMPVSKAASVTADPPTAAGDGDVVKTAVSPGETPRPTQSFRATLDGCGVRFMHSEATVAFAKLSHVGVASETYMDGSSLLNATVEDLTMRDLYSVNPVENMIIARYVDGQDLEATSSALDAASRKLLDFTVWRASEDDRLSRSMSITQGLSENNLYAQRVHCEVANLSFVLVPDVTKALAGTVTEVMQHISEVNRGKAYEYVSDTAEAAAQAVASRSTLDLSKLEVIIHRPRLLILHRADSDEGFELFPGRLTLRSELGLPKPPSASFAGAPASLMCDLYREVLHVRVERMSVKLLGQDAFKRDCQIRVVYQTALPAPPSLEDLLAEARAELTKEGAMPSTTTTTRDRRASGAAGSSSPPSSDPHARGSAERRASDSVGGMGVSTTGTVTGAYREETELRVSVSSMAMNLSGEQTRFAMDIMGAFANSEAIRARGGGGGDLSTSGAASVTSVASPSRSGESGGAAGEGAWGGRSPSRRQGAVPTTVTPGVRSSSSGSPLERVGRGASTGYTSGSAGADGRQASASASAAAVAQSRRPVKNPRAVFRSDIYIGELEADLAELFRLRVDRAHVQSEVSHATGSSTRVTVRGVLLQHVGAQVEVTDAASGGRRSKRVDDLVDLLTVRKVEVDSRSPSLVYDEDTMSTSEERSMDVRLGALRVAVSPTILFDTRELLYLPFCAKVLRRPIEPLPVLRLEEETTVLTEDLVLDAMRVVLTANRQRCCYRLDLNGYTLRLTGPPSGQIVLNEGCELTLTNGRVVIPGMYAIGSYVSFATATALFTTDTCTVEKVYQNIPNIAFALGPDGDDMKAAATAALAGRSNAPPSGARGAPRASPLTGAGARPSEVDYRADEQPVIQQRSSRLMGVFACGSVVLQVLSEETVDLSTSICVEMSASYMQDSENDVATRRNVGVQLFQVRSGDNEQHTLLPTSISANFSGVENASITLLFGPLQFCTRAVLLRSLVEIGKDFGAAFLEETTLRRFKPAIQLETEDLVPLVTVVTAGDCQHCGQHNAYLSENANTAGTLCYKCCTGRDSMPATDFRLEIPLVDAVLLASSGDMAHAYVRNVLLSIDPNMDAQMTMRGALHHFSNAAAVWEPFVEIFSCNVTGSVHTHDYRVRVDRLDYVLSPLNIRMFRTLVNDYAASTTLQKRMRKKFRRHTQERAEVGCVTAPMYVDEAQDDEDERVSTCADDTDNELTFGSSVLRGGDGHGAALAGNMSIFDLLSVSRRQSVNHHAADALGLPAGAARVNPSAAAAAAPARGRTYAHVHVENLCNATLLVDKTPVAPRGGTVELRVTQHEILVEREQAYDPTDKGFLLSLANPALYSQAKDLLIETRVELSRDEARRMLRRVVNIQVLPLHASKTLISVENKLGCWLSLGGSVKDLGPGERYYMRAPTDLTMPFVVKPTRVGNGLEYNPGLTEDGRAPTVQEALTGMAFTVVCRPVWPAGTAAAGGAAPTKSTSEDSATVYARVVVRQDAIRGGVPAFILSVEPRFRLCNKLPYPAMVSVSPDPDGAVVKGRAKPLLAQYLTVEPMGKMEVMAGSAGLGGIALTVEIHQPRMDSPTASPAGGGARPSNSAGRGLMGQAGVAASLPSSMEVFVSAPVAVKPGILKLRSSTGRELAVRLLVCRGSVVLTTPFTLLNHTDYPLTLRECNAKGEVRRVDAERNYSTLAPRMSAAIAAAPLDPAREEFLMNFYTGNCAAKVVPLHVQQRGLIMLEETVSPEAAAATEAARKACKKASKKGMAVGNLGVDVPDHAVVHLAYLSRVDVSGAILVIITPRWVVVNRSPRLPFYVVPTTQAGLSAAEAAAAATAQVTAARADENTPVSTPTTVQREMDAFREALVDLTAQSDARLTDTRYVVAVAPKSAQPLYKTPYCIPELGYHAHVLQSPSAPLFGVPVSLETIHNEVIIAYRARPDRSGDDGADDGADPLGAGGGPGFPPLGPPRSSSPTERDRFLEVSLVALDPYTYVVVEEPTTVPFLLLNRTRSLLELRDTAPKSVNRLMARAPPGCGTVLYLDPTVNTRVRVVTPEAGRRGGTSADPPVVLDVGRPMTAAERANPPGGLVYELSYGELGQTVLEIMEARLSDRRALTARASLPTPINLLLNMAVLTIAVVVPNRDILFVAITDTRLSWDREEHREEVQLSVKNFQVDNQAEISPRYDSCVLALRKSEDSTAISGMYKRTIIATKALVWLSEVRLDISPIALRVSDTLLLSLAHFAGMLHEEDDAGAPVTPAPASGGGAGRDMVASVALSRSALLQLAQRNQCPSRQRLYDQAPRQMDFLATRIILDRFIVNPLLVRLWLTRDDDESDFFRDGLHTRAAAVLSMMVASCEDVGISAPGLVAVKRSSRLGVLVQWVIKSYTDGLVAQLEGVLLQYASSLPLIGAPLKLFSGIGSGAVRLYREPVEGLATSPKAFAQGLARGSGGFAAGFAGGGLGAFSNLANAGSRLLSLGGGVSEKERRTQTTLSGLASGITGIVRRPLEGAAESGASGFAKGAAHGFIGIFANPLSGVLSDISRGTGTVAKLVTDTYIPATKRLRPLRVFHANGGVAPWRSVIEVYQYERLNWSSHKWSAKNLMSTVDGPEWYPCRREEATYGKERSPVPADCWVLDRHRTSFEGWALSSKYYGYYTDTVSDAVRVRRRRWTALVRPLPYSPMAFYLGICPGMARAPTTGSAGAGAGDLGITRTSSMDASSGADMDFTRQVTSVNLDYVKPGELNATTVEEATKKRRSFFHRRGRPQARSVSCGSSGGEEGGGGSGKARGRSSSGGGGGRGMRQSSSFYDDDEFEDRPMSVRERMRSWTAAGRNVGVRGSVLRSHSVDIDADPPLWDQGPARQGGEPPMQRPSAPRQGRFRADREQQAQERRLAGTAVGADSSLRGGGLGQSRGGGSKGGGEGGSSGEEESRLPWGGGRPLTATQAPHARTSSCGGAGEEGALPPPLPVRATVAHQAAVRGAPRLTASEDAAPTVSVTVELVEHEKKTPILGWGKRGLPPDCPAWQDVRGRPVEGRRAVALPEGWCWADEWHTVGGDDAGWMPVPDEANSGGGDLRRRRWRRTMVRQESTAPSRGK